MSRYAKEEIDHHMVWSYPTVCAFLVIAVGMLVSDGAPDGFDLVWMAIGAVASGTVGWALAVRELQLWALCSTDAATGLANRRHFQQALERELAQMTRTGQPVALLLIDLDGLKRINDEHGHAAGDNAIRTVASVLKMTCRAGDLVARWGGDEFAVIAASTGEAEAKRLAERISLAVREPGHTAVREREGGPQLSACVGYSIADPEHVIASRPQALFTAADEALYRAKARGHGWVEPAPFPPRHAAMEAVLVPPTPPVAAAQPEPAPVRA